MQHPVEVLGKSPIFNQILDGCIISINRGFEVIEAAFVIGIIGEDIFSLFDLSDDSGIRLSEVFCLLFGQVVLCNKVGNFLDVLKGINILLTENKSVPVFI